MLWAQLLYLYSILVLILHFPYTAHLCLLYKALIYILSLWNTIQSSSISNMISEPLLWPFLSSLVFISVTPFFNIASAITTTATAFRRWTSDVTQPSSLGSEPTAAVIKEFHTAQTTAARITITNIAPIAVLNLPQRSSRADLQNRGRFNVIGDRTRPHAPLKVSERLITRRHALPGPSTRRHALPRACMRQGSFADVSPRWRHRHVIYWRHLLHPLTSSATSLPCHRWSGRWPALTLTVDFDLRLTLTVDFLPELTFAVQVLLTQFFA